MRRTVAVVVAAVAGLAILTGCNSQPQRLDGAAVPAGAVQPTAAVPSAGTTAAVQAKASESANGSNDGVVSDAGENGGNNGAPVLGPDGIGKLKLGMSLKEALGTGLITGKSSVDPGGCDLGYRLKASSKARIWFKGGSGVVAIVGYPGVVTPEGIEVGSSRAAVKKAYPKYSQVSDPEPADGRGLTPVPGNSSADYRLMIENDKVTSITLQSSVDGCYE